jgi:hypothetical protein
MSREVAMSFVEMGEALGRLTQEKNEAYGDSFARSGEILGILFPDGIAPGQYQDALGIVRIVDKLFRIATRKDAFGESPWKDIAGYGILGAVADQVVEGSKPTAGTFKVGDRVRVRSRGSDFYGAAGVVKAYFENEFYEVETADHGDLVFGLRELSKA